jgi:hypothetical protein
MVSNNAKPIGVKKMSNSSFVVTITAPYKKAVFTWDEECDSCEVSAYGFEDEEMEMFVSTKAYMGKDLSGYEVTIN